MSTRSLNDQNYDLAIIGSGSAAFAAAIAARELHARVVMVEQNTLGGTCVNSGCVPSKMLLRGAQVYHQAGQQPFAGVETAANFVDYPALIAQKNQLVATMRRTKYADLIDAYGWDLIHGEAQFVDEKTIAADGRVINAKAFIIATGARPSIPTIPGLKEAGFLTSTSAMELDQLPTSLVIIGGGYVALELGQIFRHLGSEVTLLQRGQHLMPEYEPEVARHIAAMLERQGTRVLTGAHVQRADRTDAGRRLIIERGGRRETLDAEQILIATGRTPNIEALGLPKAGVDVGAHGAPVLNRYLQTTNPRVWAAGDVTRGPQFVYVAAYEGRLAAENALGATPRPVDLSAVPCVIFTDPQIAAVGLTRTQAAALGYDVRTGVLPTSMVPRALINGEVEGTFTLLADAHTNRLLGVQVVAGNAGEVIYAATLAVKHQLTVTDLIESFAPYLTMAEGLKLGALSFQREVSRLSCCAG